MTTTTMDSKMDQAWRITLDGAQHLDARLAALDQVSRGAPEDTAVPLSILHGESQGPMRDALARTLERIEAVEVLCEQLRDPVEARAIAAAHGLRGFRHP